MRLLADENIPTPSIRLLREAGHDVMAVAEDMRGAADPEVLRCAADQDRVILTFDRDFGRLVLSSAESSRPRGLVLLRFIPQHAVEPGEIVLSLLSRSDVELADRVSVVDRARVRQRRLTGETGPSSEKH